MIRVNPLPAAGCLAAGYSGYYAFKAVYQSASNVFNAILGPQSLSKRISDTLTDLKNGNFQIKKLLFGELPWDRRQELFVSSCTQLVAALGYFILSGSLYYCSTLERAENTDIFDQYDQSFKNFSKNRESGLQKQQFWQRSFCQLEKTHWDSVVPLAKSCFEASSKGWFYSEFDSICHNTFNTETYNYLNQDIIPRNEVELAREALTKERKAFLSIATEALEVVNLRVNKICNSIHPYVTVESETMCPFLKWAPLKVSDSCMNWCHEYMSLSNEIDQVKQVSLPGTKDLTLNCTEEMQKEPLDLSVEIIPMEKFLNPSPKLMKLLGKHKDRYTDYWNKEVSGDSGFHAEEQKRMEADLFLEEQDLSEEMKDFMRRFYIHRRRLVSDLAEKVQLEKAAEALPAQYSRKLKQAKDIYVS